MASSIASTARLSPTAWLSPRPIIATPPPFMIVFTSLKSRFTRPGFVMISVSPLIDRIRTSSANLNARFSDCRVPEALESPFGALHSQLAFAAERQGDDRDRQRAHLLRKPHDIAAAARAGPAAEPARHEDDVRALDDGP